MKIQRTCVIASVPEYLVFGEGYTAGFSGWMGYRFNFSARSWIWTSHSARESEMGRRWRQCRGTDQSPGNSSTVSVGDGKQLLKMPLLYSNGKYRKTCRWSRVKEVSHRWKITNVIECYGNSKGGKKHKVMVKGKVPWAWFGLILCVIVQYLAEWFK